MVCLSIKRFCLVGVCACLLACAAASPRTSATLQQGASKNSNFCLSERKYRPQNRSLHAVNEDLRTELTQQSNKKCIFRGAQQFVLPSHTNLIAVTGRTLTTDAGHLKIGYPGVKLQFRARATHIALKGHSTQHKNVWSVKVNENPSFQITLNKSNPITLYENNQLETVNITLSHDSETWHGTSTIEHIAVKGTLLPPSPLPQKKLMVIGDSVTCGEGAARLSTPKDCNKTPNWWRADNSYGIQLGALLEAQTHLVCFGGRGLVRSWNGKTDEGNAPDFYERTLADQPNSQWQHGLFPADVIVISLGTNDFNLSIGPFVDKPYFVAQYIAFIHTLKNQHPNAKVFITEGAIINNHERNAKATLIDYLQTVAKHFDQRDVYYIRSQHHPGDHCDAHPNGLQHGLMAKQLYSQIQKHLDN